MQRLVLLKNQLNRTYLKLSRSIMTATPGKLSQFLTSTRTHYLEALRSGKAAEWTIAIGNEAGDLDSCASAIAYSYLASTLFKRPTVPILRTSRADLHLRAENLYAFELAGLSSDHSDLLCIDDITGTLLEKLSVSSFALVDHNRLSEQFYRPDGTCPNVTAIIDHHEDEGYHTDANPRIITVPMGSCTSLVTQYFQSTWEATDTVPQELATLMLSAIFIDTSGLRPGGKAELIDNQAAAFLIVHAPFSGQNVQAPEVQEIVRELQERKTAISHLSSRDLLRRDYKEFIFKPSSSSMQKELVVGMATVPLSLKIWSKKESSPAFWNSMDDWMQERGLDALGVLTTFLSAKRGKHRRQQIWLVKRRHDALKTALWNGLESSQELQMKRKNMGKRSLSADMKFNEGGDLITKEAVAYIWNQGNSKLTRKFVAPLVRSIVEGLDN